MHRLPFVKPFRHLAKVGGNLQDGLLRHFMGNLRNLTTPCLAFENTKVVRQQDAIFLISNADSCVIKCQGSPIFVRHNKVLPNQCLYPLCNGTTMNAHLRQSLYHL